MSHSLFNLYVINHPDDAPELDKVMTYAADRLAALQAAVDRFAAASENVRMDVDGLGPDRDTRVRGYAAYVNARKELMRLASTATGESKCKPS